MSYRPPYASSAYLNHRYPPNPAPNYPPNPNPPYPYALPPSLEQQQQPQQQQQQQQQQPLNYFHPPNPSQNPTHFSFGSNQSTDSRGLPQYPSFSTAQPLTQPQDPQLHPPPNPIPPQLPPQVPYWQVPTPQQLGPAIHRQYHSSQNEEAAKAAAEVFERFDVDKSGYLDLQEFMDALRALHLSISYHEALECFAQCDANEDGRIGKDEFVTEFINQMKKKEYRF
eukprot:GFKZ01002319.1.p1 GENE.GFKZ01002319.1~~GFKZ01002319.1.p1  ORF type:complete len:225 (+),score=30.30 GFKZ01002319.1:211-885(+)